MLPKVIKNFNLIVDGIGFVGLAEEVTLPSLERTTESYRGGGMLGPVELDLGIEALKLEMTLAEYRDDVIKSFGITDASGINARFMAARKADNSDAASDAIEVSVRGRFKKIDPGNVKGGEMAKMKVEMPLTYLKYSVNGDVLAEIDLINGIEKIGDADRSADMRKALGLST